MDKENPEDTNDIIPNASPKSYKPMIAGVLLIVGALFTIMVASSLVTIDEATVDELIENSPQLQQMVDESSIDSSQLKEFLSICGTIGIVASILMILGGIFSIRRKFWGITIVCCLVGLISFFFTLIIVVIPIVALILVFLSKQEFQ